MVTRPWPAQFRKIYVSRSTDDGVIMKKMRKKPAPLQPFQDGQIWQLGDSNVQIAHVGKTLVHYKHYKAQTKRSPVRLSNKGVLERFLQENDAILLHGAGRLAAAPGAQA